MTEDAHKYLAILSDLSGKYSTILISYLATKQKIKEMEKIEWYDESLDRWENKQRMKETGGSIFQIREYLNESTILVTAKAIEGFTINLKVHFNIKWHVFKNTSQTARFEKEVKLIRALNNIIKHNQSILDRSSSSSAKFLVDECGLKNDTPLKYLFDNDELGGHRILELVCKSKVYCIELLAELLNTKNLYNDIKNDEIEKVIINQAVPEVLDIRKYSTT